MPQFAAKVVRFERAVFPQNESCQIFQPVADRYAADIAKFATDKCSA